VSNLGKKTKLEETLRVTGSLAIVVVTWTR